MLLQYRNPHCRTWTSTSQLFPCAYNHRDEEREREKEPFVRNLDLATWPSSRVPSADRRGPDKSRSSESEYREIEDERSSRAIRRETTAAPRIFDLYV